MSTLFLAFFTLLWSAGVLFFDTTIAGMAWKQYQSSHFTTVIGTITRSKVKTGRTSKGHTTYSADIAYRYTVTGTNFTGTKIRFGMGMSGRRYAQKIVSQHPLDSDVTVYYDPQNPGVAIVAPGLQGSDVLAVLFLTPFNAFMLMFWLGAAGWLRERIFRPIGGGVKLITDGGTIRVRLPEFPTIGWGIGIAGALGFVSIFAIGIPTDMQPSMPLVLGTSVVVYGVAIGVSLWKWQIVCTGVDDLVIDKFNRKLILPETCGRKTPITVTVPDVQSIWVEKITHYSNKGGRSYTYAPTLHMPKSETSFQKLADWSDQRKADDFAQWLSKQINVPIEPTEPPRSISESASSSTEPRSGS